MRNKKMSIGYGILTVLLMSIIVSANARVGAIDGGQPDQNTNCIGCHISGGRGIVSLSGPNESVDMNQAGIIVKARVNIESADSDQPIAGVMILTADDRFINSTGWIIEKDPNENQMKFNYNLDITVTADSEYIWVLRAPGVNGTYLFKARMMYKDNTSRYAESQILAISVVDPAQQPVEQAPQNETAPQNDTFENDVVNVTEQKLLDFGDGKALVFGSLVGFMATIMLTILRRRSHE